MKNRATTPKRETVRRRDSAAEKRLLAEYERGQLSSSVRGPKDLRRLQSAARTTLAKNRRLNICLSSPVLEGLQARGCRGAAISNLNRERAAQIRNQLAGGKAVVAGHSSSRPPGCPRISGLHPVLTSLVLQNLPFTKRLLLAIETFFCPNKDTAWDGTVAMYGTVLYNTPTVCLAEMPAMPTDKKAISVYLDERLYRWVSKEAKADGRSISNFVENHLASRAHPQTRISVPNSVPRDRVKK